MRSLAFVCLLSVAFSQPNDLTFRHLTIDDGLSQNTVNCIHQDRFGFMWFGTQDGLNRYDGYDFKIYRHEPGNANSLGNNYIWTIHEDADGIFWIGSFGGGLTRFDPSTETFTLFKHEKDNVRSLSNNHIFSIVEHPEGTLWLCTDDGLNMLDKKTGVFTRHLNTPENIEGLPTNHLDAVAVQKPDHLWLSTNNGLVRFTISSGKAEYFTADPITKSIVLGYVQHLGMYGNKLRIVCAAGLVECDFEKGATSMLIERKSIADATLVMRRALFDARGYMWLGTTSGLILSDTRTNAFMHFMHEADNEHSLTHNNILSLYRSRDDALWLGTRNGLNRVETLRPNFVSLKRRRGRANTLSHKSVNAILEDKRGTLWIGTHGGLNAYDRKTETFTHITHDPRNVNSLGSSYILALYEDSRQNIWIGTRGGGISRMTRRGNTARERTLKHFRGDGRDGLRSTTVHSILEDSKGTIWIGTAGRGLAKFISERDGFKHFETASDGSGPSHPFVYCIFEDSFGNMWLGTPTGGLNLFDRESERFLYIRNSPENPNSLSNNIVLAIHEDAARRLWVGTAGGLNRLAVPLRKNLFHYFRDSVNLAADSLFKNFGRNDGFPNDVIYGMLEDSKRQLWLSTNKGLIVFDAEKAMVVRTFDASDGLQNNEFNQNGFFKNANGEMFFGGIDGVSCFHPDSLRGNSYIPPIVFTDFRLFNKSVPLAAFSDSKSFSLQKTIHQTETLHLSYEHVVLSFDFVALSFISPEKNQYAYMLEGFDNDWIAAGANRSVTYTNLDAGDYILRVKASNNDGVWNEEGASLRLIIPPPPWRSWYAYLFYAGLLAAAVALVIRYRVKAATRAIRMKAEIERAKAEERDVVRRQSSADFHDEAGHKLTKISLFTELARGESKNNSSLREYLNKIEEQTKELSSGMRDFIWVLDPSKESLSDTIHRLKDFGNSMFGYSDIDFTVEGATAELNTVVLSMESRRALMMIFKEAMNNCLKYSAAQSVRLTVAMTNGILGMTLADDGKGFDVSAASNGYGMKTMRERAEKIGAQISVVSTLGAGAHVYFRGEIARLRE